MSQTKLPRLTPEQRRAAAGQFDRAGQVLAQKNYDYAIPLLVACCEIDPGNLMYRKILRQAERDKYQDNQKGAPFAGLKTLYTRMKMEAALKRGEYPQVLQLAERILIQNPWNVRAQVAMAIAYEEMDLIEHAIWVMEQVLLTSKTAKLHKKAAQLYEKKGMYTQAIFHWNQVRKLDPADPQASSKAKNLAASATIAKGKYEEAMTDGAKPKSAVETHTHEAMTSPDLPPAPPEPAETRGSREAAQLRSRIEANPTNPNGYLHLAQFHRRLDQFDQARQVLHEGLGPTGNNVHLSLELLDLEIEPFRRDLDLAERKLVKDPKNAEILKIRQELVKEINTRELSYYRQKSDRSPTDTASRFEMALRLLRAGQVEEAIKEFQNLRGDARNLGKILFYLGFCFQTRNHWRLAQRNFEEALQQLPPGEADLRKETLYLLAHGYAEHGDFQRAVDLGCELANLDYSFKNIGNAIEGWQTKLHKVK